MVVYLLICILWQNGALLVVSRWVTLFWDQSFVFGMGVQWRILIWLVLRSRDLICQLTLLILLC